MVLPREPEAPPVAAVEPTGDRTAAATAAQRPRGRLRGVGIPAAVGAAGLLGAAAVVGGTGEVTASVVATLVVAAVWVLAAVAAHRGGARPVAAWAAALAVGHAAVAVWPVGTPLVLAGWLGFGLALPRGGLRSVGWRSGTALAGLVGGAVWTALDATGAAVPGGAGTVIATAVVAVVALSAVAARCRTIDAAGRRTLQWVAAGVVLAAAAAAVLLALTALVGVPGQPVPWIVGALALVPAALALGVHPASAPAAATALVEAVVTAGIAAMVVVVYLVVVIGLGHAPVAAEREVLVSSIVAAIVVAVLALPARARLLASARALVGRDTGRGDEMASFGSRMTRAVPMDELLLQLAESLRDTLAPGGAEVWVGTDGVLDRTVTVPDRPAHRLELGEHERLVVGRARSGGARWMSVWLPDRLAEHAERLGPDAPVRAVPVAHLGELLGLLVVHRPAGADPFAEEDERVLVELARQLGLALHNVRLDSALQASLEELQRRNAELQASRARIVTAADESRRAIERDLHDGAQQHLVALAVKIGLAKVVAQADPAALPGLLDQLRADAQTAIGAVRELAHGIYPPLLRDRGLGEALRTAATRSPLTCAVEVDLPGRYPPDIEACVYFCCLEAIQNAGKHAGAGAEILVQVDGTSEGLRFSVRDDGAGFSAEDGAGHGFVNMRDRLGAVGGELGVESAPGAGATISGRLPAAVVPS
jgi:signal transduction histidine kinase